MLTRDSFRVPADWPIYVGFDTGTYMSASFTTFIPDPYAAVTFEEFPNYRYIGGEIELLDMPNKTWAEWVLDTYNHYRPHTSRVKGWVDENTQFRAELAHYGLVLMGNPRKLELRTEISREYIQARDPFRYYMTPWLTVLPYEMERAKWPDGTTPSGKYERIKEFDHTLDTVEHVLSRKPQAARRLATQGETFLERFFRENRHPSIPGTRVDPHLGRL